MLTDLVSSLDIIHSLGAPLSETDLKPMEDLEKEIKNWNPERTEANMTAVNVTSRNIVNNSNSVKESCSIPRSATDDLYEF